MTAKLFCTICLPALVCVLLVSSCNSNSKKEPGKENTSKEPRDVSRAGDLYVDLEKLLLSRDTKLASEVHVKYDHYFKKSKDYVGFYIAPIFDSIIKSTRFDTTNTIVVFECNDGYKPIMDHLKNIR